MYTDREEFEGWMERIMERFDRTEKLLERVLRKNNTLDGEVIFKKYSPIGEMNAVAALVHVLEHGFFALVGYVFHDALLPGQLVQIAVHRGGVGACALRFQMLQNVGSTHRVLPVVDEII